jgi:hypothetical protein
LTLDADGFGPDGLSRVHIVQFVAIGAIATSSREYFLHEAIRHELVTVLRCVLFARIALGDAPFQRSQSRSVVHEANEVSRGGGRKRVRSNARRGEPPDFFANDGGSDKVSPRSFLTVASARTNLPIAPVLRFGRRCSRSSWKALPHMALQSMAFLLRLSWASPPVVSTPHADLG